MQDGIIAEAPGAPGLSGRWTSSAKSGVGTALDASSRVWFTMSHGILNEIYYPRVDTACTRDFGMIVTGPDGYFSEEKRDTRHRLRRLADGVPAFWITNTAIDDRYRITKVVLTDPRRDVLLQAISFEALQGAPSDYRLYGLLAPHLVNAGADNTAWIDEYKGTRMLFASGKGGTSLAIAASVPWRTASAGFVGASDGWQQLKHTGTLIPYARAANGNVALTGEFDLAAAGDKPFLVAVGFASRPEEAAHRVLASLGDGFEPARKLYMTGWHAWQSTLESLDRPGSNPNINPYRVSTEVLAVHQPVSFHGAAIASLSIPWGFSKGDEDLGGYHLVWPRDLVETAGGFLAAGAVENARAILSYLRAVQEADGHWSQNMWLDGSPYWTGVQMDECAFPILLLDLLNRGGHMTPEEKKRYLAMVTKAARFIVNNGPVTGQDRWEEDAGYSPFTLAVEIAALLAAADFLDEHGEPEAGRYLRELADIWNDEIERWTFAEGTDICAELGVKGYYVRIAPPDTADAASALDGFVPIKNRPPADTNQPARAIVSPDALALVRFGLRAPDDPRILDTVRVIDAVVKVDLPQGPLWKRYNGDGYGEHEDGRAFNGTGIGRPWPLLAAERAHYELAAGNRATAESLLATVEASASDGGMLPEQIWDAPDIPERELLRGRPSGSAMPLVWAHSEHIKLLRSLRDGAVFDMPPQPVARYQKAKTTSPVYLWRMNQKARTMPAGKRLRIETRRPAMIRWSLDNWATQSDLNTTDTHFDLHQVDLPTAAAPQGTVIHFTARWLDDETWEGQDYAVTVV
ncbi:glucan 1,4-alpha-glucosidase [Segnochrobactrum spirostomi]|uniref:Glucan 1,4-alpha-glucosidase n=1 Tax=Segnochrobactrum spirostomi TaxID=2608987 RepID=A0A6A7Y5E4_9HYPH|nr:glucan 1,4-alpha-glucosidase [Segnochrobactrum spirostomi]MQT14423.1 glucan 1,4-alpha-glucosidase [Segnochrobactrum spirostomi]